MSYKAYLIDPANKSVTETTVPKKEDGESDLKDIYRQLDCRCFDLVRISETDSIYVDDEGLYSGAIERHGLFVVTGNTGRTALLAGRGLVMGSDPETGNTADVAATKEQIESMVSFPDRDEIRERVNKGEFG